MQIEFFKLKFMKSEKNLFMKKNIDEEIRSIIRKKKEENSALKKLLIALEDAKKTQQLKNNA